MNRFKERIISVVMEINKHVTLIEASLLMGIVVVISIVQNFS